jgi:hypothetical protein
MPTTSPVPGAGSEPAYPSPDGVATRDQSPPPVTNDAPAPAPPAARGRAASGLLAKVLGLVRERGVRTD